MKCDYCKQDLIVVKSNITTEMDTLDVHSEQTLVCTNTKCKIYAGTDLTNPKHVAKTLKVKVN